MKRIHKVAVLGAGTMGARIAAHFANAGVPSYLLDMVPPDADKPMRNKIAAGGLEAAKKSKPAAFFDTSLANLVTVGNSEDDLKKVAEVDWIIEAVVENLEIKRDLLKKVEAVRHPGTIITTNTSGLPVAKISEGFSDDFRRCWFGTHFFNPPRYMRLLELIPTPETDRALLESVERFADVRQADQLDGPPQWRTGDHPQQHRDPTPDPPPALAEPVERRRDQPRECRKIAAQRCRALHRITF